MGCICAGLALTALLGALVLEVHFLVTLTDLRTGGRG